jgi:ubiquinone/menaquinone biosynthesis C-methylase UbiE
LKEEPDKINLNAEYVFDNFAERYDAWYDRFFGKSAFRLEKSCIVSLCANLWRPFLEIGVGTGRFAEVLRIEHGVDTSVGMLRFAKKRGIITVKGACEKLPFSDKFFGAVFIIVTLCFVDDPSKVLVEASRVLKDEGSIVLGLILKGSS